MQTLPKSDGLFAKRRTIQKDNDSFLHALLYWLAGILLGLILCGCRENPKGQHAAKADSVVAADSVKSKVSMQVNKRQDASYGFDREIIFIKS